jgi:hypothetical protein
VFTNVLDQSVVDMPLPLHLFDGSARTSSEYCVRTDVMGGEIILNQFRRFKAGFRIAFAMTVDLMNCLRCMAQKRIQERVARSIKRCFKHKTGRKFFSVAIEYDEAAEMEVPDFVKAKRLLAFNDAMFIEMRLDMGA